MPLSARENPEIAQRFGVLRRDVAEWLLIPLHMWMEANIPQYHDQRIGGSSVVYIEKEWIVDFSTSLRMQFPLRVTEIPHDRYLDVIDRILYRGVHEAQRTELDHILSQGGSLWRATERGLERRVEAELQSAADSVFDKKERYAQYLREAWQKAWGLNPDASGAYWDSARAVEAAYKPIVSPDNKTTTLGTIIRDVSNKPTKFRVRLQIMIQPGDGSDNVKRIVAMLELLWKSEFDRHSSDDETVPLNVSIEEAQDAVALATILVHLAQQGGFTAAR